MNAPIFIELDPAVLLAQNVQAYEEITGRVLQPSQAERLLINAFTEILHLQVCAERLRADAR